MKLSFKFAVYYVVAFVIFTINMAFFIGDQFFYSLKDLPDLQEGQTAVYSAFSPDLQKSAVCYTVETPEGNAVCVELVTYDEDTNIADKENIYWEVGKDSVIIGWVDENTITIDSNTLDLSKNQTFDSRRVVSLRGK